MDAGNPQNWNRYVYVANDPVNLADPTGLCEKGDTKCLEHHNNVDIAYLGNFGECLVEGIPFSCSIANNLQASGAGADDVRCLGWLRESASKNGWKSLPIHLDSYAH
jgi:hypothetical protein